MNKTQPTKQTKNTLKQKVIPGGMIVIRRKKEKNVCGDTNTGNKKKNKTEILQRKICPVMMITLV